MTWFFSLAPEVQLAIIGIFATIVGAWVGTWRESKKPAEKPQGGLTLAGALIDSSKADELVAILRTEADASSKLATEIRLLTNSVERMIDEAGEARTDMRELRGALFSLREELRVMAARRSNGRTPRSG